MFFRIMLVFLLAIFQIQCEKLALITTPKKKAMIKKTALSTKAEDFFWNALHAGQYDQIDNATRLLTAAYLENPYNPLLAAHLGFLHIWKITERGRKKIIEPTIVNEIILAKKYFADSIELAPSDARYQGFFGDSMLMTGKIFHDKREEVRGYFQLLHAIRLWPEFNYFSAGYPMSTLPIDDLHFKEALAWQWRTMSLCAGVRIHKNNADFSPYLARETKEGPQRACWNSWIAPHNFEGFFLNMGDMLVKSGDTQTALKIYRNATLSRDYASWPFKKLLEKRMQHVQENVINFQKNNTNDPDRTLIFNSGYGCAVCHQKN